MVEKKEKLGVNQTTATLFVGVGGIGSDIVRRVAEMCREGETENIRFVTMDTNVNDLKNIKSSRASIIPIQTSSPQRVLDYLKSDDSARLEWFPNNTTLYPKTVSEGAGQVRAISRLALNATIKTNEIGKLYKAIDTLFLKDGGEFKQALRVSVVSSATGGTGSGMAMIVSMLIRDYLMRHYPEKAVIVRGFFVLPGVMDTVIPTEKERESQRRNGYATIKEINAFMVKASGFCGVRKELARFENLHIDVPNSSGGVDRLEHLPFDFCFLLDRVDQNQENMMTLEQYKDFAARALFEQNIGPMQRNAFSIEDNIIKEFADKNNYGRNRFGGIGASALIYPYEDIADYIAYSRAIDRIGSEETAGEWLKYDVKFKQAVKEFKKKRSVSTEEAPKIEDIYVSEINSGEARFDIDVKRQLASNADEVEGEVTGRITLFLSQFETEILEDFSRLPDVSSISIAINTLGMARDFKENENLLRNAASDLATVRTYENIVKQQAASVAKNRAMSILQSPFTVNSDAVKPYHLESLLKSNDGAIHPNAMRYTLYLLKKTLERNLGTYREEAKSSLENLVIYSQSANDENFYDIKNRKSPEKEKNFDEICNLAIKGNGFPELYDKLNELFTGYVYSVDQYKEALLKEKAYQIALNHVNTLCKQFESFYASFAAKVTMLSRKKEDIVNALKYLKGNSVRYVCGTKDHLDLILERCPEGSDGLLLPPDLNSQIFDAIKKNAEADRLAEFDTYSDFSKSDVFEDVLIDYFRNSAREDYGDVIDLDIIHAIALENKLSAYIAANKLKNPGEELEIPKITEDEKNEYVTDKIISCHKLASPGIGIANFEEPRNVPLVTFNSELLKARDFNIKSMLESMGLQAKDSNTVSKYELRFFTALYNITPENLSRFKAPESLDNAKETYEESLDRGGLYYRAYRKYIQDIGPDSTKCATISLHIDKRWDSITELPEIDLDSQNEEMVHIHSALIYGIIHGMLKTHPSSRYDCEKRIYAFEDLEGDVHTLVVSNNTECDEFYEVLDALYRDRATVAQIFQMAENLRFFDVESNHRFIETEFYKDLGNFKVGDGHSAPTSLFEIPMEYFNSLPRFKMDDNELATVIDSVIRVLEDEINRFEQTEDRAPYLSARLEEQFRLFIDNVIKYKQIKEELLSDNKVVTMVLKKVCNKIKALGTFKFQDKIAELRKFVQEKNLGPTA